MVEQNLAYTGRVRLRLTSEYLWIDPELSIPLPALTSVTLSSDGTGITFSFRHAIEGGSRSLHLCALTWYGGYDRRRVVELKAVVEAAWNAAPTLEAMLGHGQAEGGKVSVKCESCGAESATVVDLGYFLCVGFYPIAGVYAWVPKKRILCEDHAKTWCLIWCLWTGMIGYLGIPGVFVAPFRVWKNVRQVRAAFGTSWLFLATAFLCGLLGPIAIATLIVWPKVMKYLG